MQRYYDILMALEIPEAIHPMPMGRYYQCMLLYTHFVAKKPLNKLLQQIFSIEKRMPRVGLHFKNFPGFHYFVVDGLVLTHHFKEAIKLMGLAVKDYKMHREFVWKGYYRQFQLLAAECYLYTGKREQA